ncbi:MAG TPA: GNAT family N-acetyltransferase [Devosiaceae bacterium]
MSLKTSSPQHFASHVRYYEQPQADDAERVAALARSTGVFSDEEARVAGELVTTTLDGRETYQFLLAEDDNHRLIGFTCFDRIPLTQSAFDLYWIVVAPEWAGTGLARDLMRRTADVIRVEGGTQILAETSERKPYARARRFYLGTGFQRAARFADFYGPNDAKIVFRMLL